MGSPFVSCQACTAGPSCSSLVTPRQYRNLSGLCNPLADPFSPPGTSPDYGHAILNQFAAMLARWLRQLQPFVPGARGGPGELNPASGNLLLRMGPPSAGPFDPSTMLVYNAQAPAASEFGWGWSLVPKQTLTSLTANSVSIVDGAGTPLRYSLRDATTNRYLGPGGGTDALQFNPVRPDLDADAARRLCAALRRHGTHQLFGDSGGGPLDAELRRRQSGDDADRPVPASHQPGLRRVEQPAADSAARRPRHQRDGRWGRPPGRLRLPRPEPHQPGLRRRHAPVDRFTDPNGQRTSYSYAASGQVQSIQTPTGNRTSYAYQTGGPTRVTDANGRITTLLFNLARNIGGVIDPLGRRTTYLWATNNLVGHVDAKGARTSLTYASLPDRTVQLQSIVDALSGRYTLAYDGSSRLAGLQDQLGQQTTLLWGGAGGRDRIGVIDPLGAEDLVRVCEWAGHSADRPAGAAVVAAVRRRGADRLRGQPAGAAGQLPLQPPQPDCVGAGPAEPGDELRVRPAEPGDAADQPLGGADELRLRPGWEPAIHPGPAESGILLSVRRGIASAGAGQPAQPADHACRTRRWGCCKA